MESDDDRAPGPPPRRVWGLALALGGVLTLTALVVTFAYLRQQDDAVVPDLLAVAAERSAAAQVALATGDPTVAHEFILDQFGWPLEVPPLTSATLTGVGVDPLAEGVELPFLRYRTPEGGDVTVYAFDYAFLDAAARQVTLAPAVYAHLADPVALDVRRQDGRYLVVWRRRAAIYAAVTADEDAGRALADEVRLDD
jgi:hypothetical protein